MKRNNVTLRGLCKFTQTCFRNKRIVTLIGSSNISTTCFRNSGKGHGNKLFLLHFQDGISVSTRVSRNPDGVLIEWLVGSPLPERVWCKLKTLSSPAPVRNSLGG